MKITLKEIIGQYLSSATQGSHEFLRLWNIAVFGLKTEFNLDVTGELKTVVIDVNANGTVDLPCDYISYSKIGVVNGQGEIATFKRNDQLTTYDSGEDNRIEGTPRGGVDASYIGITTNNYPFVYGNYYYNGAYYNLFGLDSGTQVLGEYKLDERNKLIYLNLHNHYPKIVLEYLSDGFDDGCDDYSVDIKAVKAVVSYIRWQEKIDQPKKYAAGYVQNLKRDYYNEKRLAKMRLNPFVLNEMRAVNAASLKLVAKSS